MSADDWLECPFCNDKLKIWGNKLFEEGKKSFSEDEWDEYECLKEQIKEEFDGTPMREDYALGVNQETKLAFVIYGCCCQICDTSFNFKKDDIKPEFEE